MSASVLKGLDPEYRDMVVETVRQLRKRLLTKERILELDRKELFPEAEIREMLGPDIGLQLVFVPEEMGGMGGGARDCCAVTKELAKICLGVATAFFAIQLGADPILVGATDEQQQKWLGKIASGESLVAYAVTEPGAGSNLAALSTKADPVEENGKIIGYILNGNKQFISTGGYADFVTVLAKTPEGPTFFVVEKDATGFSQGKGEEKMGIRASNTCPLTFTDVFVPIENLIGEKPGEGLKQANAVFGYTRLMVASLALGAGEAALEIAVNYAKERIQFGGPLSDKQGYTHKLIVPNVVKTQAASAYIDEVAIRLDSSDEELQVEGSIAKFFSSEIANQLADDAIQALGGYGYVTEFEVEKIKRDVKITCIYEGTSEIQQSIISAFRWKVHCKTKGAFYNDIAVEMEKLEEKFPAIGAKYFAAATTALADLIDHVHNKKLTREQLVMFSLADTMTYVEVGVALARKAAKHIENKEIGADFITACASVFAAQVSDLVLKNTRLILKGTGVFNKDDIKNAKASSLAHVLSDSNIGLIENMTKIRDFVFQDK